MTTPSRGEDRPADAIADTDDVEPELAVDDEHEADTESDDIDESDDADDTESDDTDDTDDTDDEADTATTTGNDAGEPRRSRRRGRLVTALVVVLVAAMTALGVVFVVAAGRADDGDGGNLALVDQATTTQVIGEVSQALNTVLSYDYTKPDASAQAASQLLVGDARTQYTTLFDALKQKAPGQQLTLTAKTVSAAVSALTDNTAQLLVFLNQTSTRASDKSTSSSAAQLQIAAVRSGDSWKISELQPL